MHEPNVDLSPNMYFEIYVCLLRKERRQNKPIRYGPVRKRGGGPGRYQNIFFFSEKKDKNYSEMEKYVKHTFWQVCNPLKSIFSFMKNIYTF